MPLQRLNARENAAASGERSRYAISPGEAHILRSHATLGLFAPSSVFAGVDVSRPTVNVAWHMGHR
jgi:hypothetical protein